MLDHRAIYQNGWVAAARHPAASGHDFTHDRWELYHIDEDFSQARDLAARHPRKLKQLQQLFDTEARQNDVYPLGAVYKVGTSPSLSDNKREFVYYSRMPRLPETMMPPLAGKSFRITANVVIPASGAEGIIVSYGGRESGFAFYLKDDRLIFENNPLNGTREVIASNIRLPRGDLALTYEFNVERVRESKGMVERLAGGMSSGTGRLLINGQTVGEAKLTGAMVISRAGPGSLGIGQAFGSPVSDVFQLPFRFTGILEKVTVTLE